jgi:hypothetical protein
MRAGASARKAGVPVNQGNARETWPAENSAATAKRPRQRTAARAKQSRIEKRDARRPAVAAEAMAPAADTFSIVISRESLLSYQGSGLSDRLRTNGIVPTKDRSLYE